MRPLGYDQPETLAQGDYPTTLALIQWQSTRHLVAERSCSGNTSQTENVVGASGTTMGGRDGLSSPTVTHVLVLL